MHKEIYKDSNPYFKRAHVKFFMMNSFSSHRLRLICIQVIQIHIYDIRMMFT